MINERGKTENISEDSWPSYILQDRLNAKLVLKNGRVFQGYSIGHKLNIHGEVVFNTGMVGYPQSLTDPSYHSQILVITYPLIGNYGVSDYNKKDKYGMPISFESDKIHVKGLIIADYSQNASHYTSYETLKQWLIKSKIPAIAGIDTRALTKHLRDEGSVLGRIIIDEADEEETEEEKEKKEEENKEKREEENEEKKK